MALRLSGHFRERWMQRVGNQPTRGIVLKVLREGVKLQHCRDLYEKDGTPFRMLALYWHPELGVVVSVDNIDGLAVSVLSTENFKPKRGPQCTAKRTAAR